MKNPTNKRRPWRPAGKLLLAAAALALCLAGVGGVYAYLVTGNTTQLQTVNTMQKPPEPRVYVTGLATEPDGDIALIGVGPNIQRQQSRISIGGGLRPAPLVDFAPYPVYIRAAVSFFFDAADQNQTQRFYAASPQEGIDYSVTYNTADWTRCGDYWYYNQPVLVTPEGDGQTTYLYDFDALNGRQTEITIQDENGSPVNIRFSVGTACYAQCVQAGGTTLDDQKAIEDAWDVKVALDGSGNITSVTQSNG